MSDVIEILLVRHASTAWSGQRYCGRSDPVLSAQGRSEAAALAARLATSARLPAATRIVSSPARRAVATAEAIAAGIGSAPIELDDRWREVDFGRAEGRTFDEVAAIEPDLAAALLAGVDAIDWPDGETAAALADRVTEAWSELCRAARPAIVVTHGGPILRALKLARGEPTTADELLPPATEVRVEIAVGRAAGSPVLPSGA